MQVWIRRFALLLLPLGFLAVMVAAPLLSLAFYDGEGAWAEVVADDYMRLRLGWTVAQAVLTCVLVTALGVPAAWVLARMDFAGRRTVLRLLMLPFVMPTLVAGMGVLALFGAHGMLASGWQDTPWLLIYGNVFFNLPVLVRSAYQGFVRVPQARLLSAQSLGADAWRRFVWVEWPVVRAWVAGGACLVFLYCFSGFGLALLLGGERFATVEVEIYRLVAYELDMARASVLVWLVLAVTAAAGGLYAYWSRRVAVDKSVSPLPPRAPIWVWEKWLTATVLAMLAVCCLLPLTAVWLKAVSAGSSWAVLLEAQTWAAVWNTIRFSAAAVAAATVLGVLYAAAARQMAWLRALMFLPFMVSPVCLSFGVLLLYPSWSASLPMLIALYALLAYPFVTKDILSAWDALPANYIAAARVSGASRFQAAYAVTLPLLLPALRRGLTLAAATCIGEFAATLFLSRPEWTTLTTLIYRYLSKVGAANHDKALVLTAVLLGLSLLVFVVLDASDRQPEK